jgi:hypothetical protein
MYGMSVSRVALPPKIRFFRAFTVAIGLVAGGAIAYAVWETRERLGPTACEKVESDFSKVWESLPPEGRELLEAAGYASGQRFAAVGNFDSAFIFSSDVMLHDPYRAYRFRPSQQISWVRAPSLSAQVPIPRTERTREILNRTGIVITSTERINSLGCRGPEVGDPLSHDFRVLVLGDSFTEGILVEEPDTFCAHLGQMLSSAAGREVLVLNSGIIGYSTEQEYFTLVELAPRVHPHVAVVCFFANDVHHEHHAVMKRRYSKGNWEAARHWLEKCRTYCRKNSIRLVIAVIPDRTQLDYRPSRLSYQYRVEAIAADLGVYFIDPYERFLSHREEELFLADDHFGPAGHRLFAEVLAEHLEQWMRRDLLKE